jgi:CDP-glucose 4,6-dehydratase
MESSLEPEIRNEASNEIRQQYLDASKARRMLDWSPSFTLETGLRATLAWYHEYFAERHDGAAPEATGG